MMLFLNTHIYIKLCVTKVGFGNAYKFKKLLMKKLNMVFI